MISTHVSKSVTLPVYLINLKELGIEIILRDNLYDWKVSVSSDSELYFETMDLFDEFKIWNSTYCEGFPNNKIFGCYNENKFNFTIRLDNNYGLYTFL